MFRSSQLMRIVAAIFFCGALGAVATAQPRIHATWSGSGGGALNVHVDGLPAGASVTVTVTDVSNGSQPEQPVGTPPANADSKGRWPGPQAGGKTGYPGTASDPGGTKYVVTVRVNGKTGPAKRVEKPKPKRSFWSILATLGGVLLTDAVGVTGSLETGPVPFPAIGSPRPVRRFIEPALA